MPTITREAAMKTPAELVAEVRRRRRIEGDEGFATVSSADIIREDRESH